MNGGPHQALRSACWARITPMSAVSVTASASMARPTLELMLRSRPVYVTRYARRLLTTSFCTLPLQIVRHMQATYLAAGGG